MQIQKWEVAKGRIPERENFSSMRELEGEGHKKNHYRIIIHWSFDKVYQSTQVFTKNKKNHHIIDWGTKTIHFRKIPRKPMLLSNKTCESDSFALGTVSFNRKRRRAVELETKCPSLTFQKEHVTMLDRNFTKKNEKVSSCLSNLYFISFHRGLKPNSLQHRDNRFISCQKNNQSEIFFLKGMI